MHIIFKNYNSCQVLSIITKLFKVINLSFFLLLITVGNSNKVNTIPNLSHWRTS